jgi:hypothetical protein
MPSQSVNVEDDNVVKLSEFLASKKGNINNSPTKGKDVTDMITPQFTLSQTEKHLLIEIRAPHIKVLPLLTRLISKAQDVSLFVEDTLFILSVTPYYLRYDSYIYR